MIKNPSFCTIMEVITGNLEQHNRETMTIACLIGPDGTMVLYDSIEELFMKIYPRDEMPQALKASIFTEYCVRTNKYFFHASYEYIPTHLTTPEMDARIMMWQEALSCKGVKVVPANVLNHSGRALIGAGKLILDEEKYRECGMHYHPGDLGLLKACKENTLVDRLDHEYNDVAVYGLKLETEEKSTMDPAVTFKDIKGRPAVVKKKLSGFLDTYAKYMAEDSEFEVFVYPDGTAANMTGYSVMDIDMAVSDADLENYIYGLEDDDVAEMLLTGMDETDRFAYKLQMLRIVCIVGNDSVMIPYPITPQQSVFLEGLQEFGHIIISESNVSKLTDIYDMSVARVASKIPLQMSNGFMFGGTSYYCGYSQLSPDMRRKVDSVMTITEENCESYLFDATNEDKVFVIDMEAAL